MKRFAVAVLAALTVAVVAVPAQAQVTTYHGQWLCDDRGIVMALGGIETQLWRRGSPDYFPVEWVGGIADSGFANPDGTFSLRSGDGEDNHFIRMALRDSAGVRLKDWGGINDWSIDLEGYRNNTPDRDLFGRLFITEGQSHKCAIWRGLHLAHRDFRDLMGFPPPTGSGGLLIQADAPGQTPLADDVEIWWTPGYVTGYAGGGDDSLTRHEFGHVIRHGYDGDATHFFGDVAAHGYLRGHDSCLRSGGMGYAFNEGWAEYWAHDYYPAPNCEGAAPDDYTIEGNVAAALADVEARCYYGNRVPMVNILRSNRGTIHSFPEFFSHVVCPAPLLVYAFPPMLAPPPPIELTPSERAALARTDVRELDSQIGRLRGALQVAESKAAKPLECKKTPCEAALKRAVLPAVLRTEIALAQLARNAADDGDTAAEQAAMDKLSFKRLNDMEKARERADRIKAARISADGIRDALKAGRAVFAKDKSAKTRRLRSLLGSRLASFRKAQRGATGVPGLILDQALAGRIKKMPPIPFPNPEPPPPPWTPIPIPTTPPTTPPITPPPGLLPSALTLVCPPTGKPGVYAITGGLTPARPGVKVEVHVAPPSNSVTGPSVQTTTTDGSANYSIGISMNTAGTWKLYAHWEGDLQTQSDDSPTCQTVVS